MAKSTVSMKLLIDARSNRVLFAEAGKDCVDSLFDILAMPVANLLEKQGMEGSLPNLYRSFESLESYIQPNKTKDTLLKPVSQVCGSSVPRLLLNDAPTEKKLYMCACTCNNNVFDDPRAICPNCLQEMTRSVTYVAPPPPVGNKAFDEGGFVKGDVTYMIMDNLEVKPMSTISSITLLNKFKVKVDVADALEEKVVDLGKDELLKASLTSQTVLTDVYQSKFLIGESSKKEKKEEKDGEKKKEEKKEEKDGEKKKEKKDRK